MWKLTLHPQRTRAWVWSEREKGTLLSGCQGNPQLGSFTSYGCPVFSSGESSLDELILVTAQDTILDWLLEALKSTQPGGYCNPVDVSLPLPSDLPADEPDDDDETEEQKKYREEQWARVPDAPKDAMAGLNSVDAEDIDEENMPQVITQTFPSPAVPDAHFGF